jgi:hypothetical protein
MTASEPGLLQAILKVQAEVGTLPKDATNPHFKSKYTPLDTIVEHVGPILNKHGLIWLTLPTRDELGPALTYRLQHAASGEKVEGTMPLLLTKQDPQGLGSALTYARRYSLCAVLNLVADDDDDGNAARNTQPAGQLARARANMSDQAKALLAEADRIYAESFDESSLSRNRYESFKDSTGYVADGLQRLVDWLRANVPEGAAA